MRASFVLAVLASASFLGAADVFTAAPMFEIKDHVQTLREDNLELRVTLEGLMGNTNLVLALVDGKWLPGSASAGFNKAGHMSASDSLVSKGGKISGNVTITVYPDAYIPSDKKSHVVPVTVDLTITPSPKDPLVWEVTGTWKGKNLLASGAFAESETSGAVKGTAVRPVGGDKFNIGSWVEGKGLEVAFDLGDKRVNWNRYSVVRHGFSLPQNWSSKAGLRLSVRTDTPRNDAEVGLWIREEDGSWYYVRNVCPLSAKENQGIAWFSDFTEAEWVCPGSHQDEDYTLDLNRIAEFAIGIVNPMGIGSVKLYVSGIELIEQPSNKVAPTQVAVSGKTLSVNKQEMIPVGVFGGYAPDLPAKYRPGCTRKYFTTPSGGPTLPKLGEKFVLDMWGDRTHTAEIVTNPKWKETLTKNATDYAIKAKAKPGASILEFWNEPYLDWAKPGGAKGSVFGVGYYDTSKAVAGGPVHLKYDGTVVPNFQWVDTGKVQLVAADGSRPPKGSVIPENLKVGDKITLKVQVKGKPDVDREFIAQTEWKIKDTTQFTYWAGQGIGFLYDSMAVVVSKTIKDICPDIPVVVGWEFRWNEDHWAAWDLLYKPTLDHVGAWIDGATEHHYQGDTTAMPGTYEVLTAYGLAKFGKWWRSYNTETNDLLDLPARSDSVVNTPEKAKAAEGYHRFAYNMRDCLYDVLQTPDKIGSRTMIHHDHYPQSTEITYGLLADLRGRMVATTSSDEKVWCVASIDGTDPEAMPADGKAKLVVFVWNDHRVPQKVEVKITPPTGTTFTQEATCETVTVTPDFVLSIDRKQEAASKDAFSTTLAMVGRGVTRIVLPLTGSPINKAEIVQQQCFAKEILQTVSPTKALDLKVPVANELITGASRAWLRLVVEDLADNEGVVSVNGTDFVLPRSVTNDNSTRIVVVPISMAQVKTENALNFRVNSGNFRGYRVDMASIVVER